MKYQLPSTANHILIQTTNGHHEDKIYLSKTENRDDQDKPVTSRPNKDEFEPTSGPSVSGIACVWGVVPPC